MSGRSRIGGGGVRLRVIGECGHVWTMETHRDEDIRSNVDVEGRGRERAHCAACHRLRRGGGKVRVTALRTDRCEECAKQLNQYNQSGLCGACTLRHAEERAARIMAEAAEHEQRTAQDSA